MEKKPLWYRFYGKLVKLVMTKKTSIRCLGAPIEGPSLVLSNHEGAAGPLTWEYHLDRPKKFWTAYEMTAGLRSVYRYLAFYYFPEKKHFSRFFSRVVGFVGSPFVHLVYKGMAPIPTSNTPRKLVSTLRASENALKAGYTMIVFPEDSSKGYFEKPKYFFSGFVVLGERMLTKGVDLPVYTAYFSKKKRTITVDAPVSFSSLRARCESREEISEALRLRMNELADL